MRRRWDQLRASYWFVPLITAVLAFFLGQFILWLDVQTANIKLSISQLIFSGNASEARIILLGLAATILATTGVVFTMITVPLSLAATQFGSRLLRLYLRNRTTQYILGLFVGTFIYCLTVGLSLPPGRFVEEPQWATAVGLLLSLITFASLLVLIQNIATSLQAPNMVAAASSELHDVIRQSISAAEQIATSGDMADYATLSAQIEQDGAPILGQKRGYVQAIDPELLLPLAVRHNLVIRLVRKPGDFIQHDELIALAWPPQRVNGFVAATIHRSYELGNLRTPTQDIEYAVNQLVEVAVRAMSPAINDPFTAMTCLDHLGAGLALYAEQHRKAEHFTFIYDEESRLRLVVDSLTFTELLDTALNMIRRVSREHADVLLGMLAALETIMHKCTDPEYRAALRLHVQLIEAECQAGSLIEWDKQRVNRHCSLLQKLLTD